MGEQTAGVDVERLTHQGALLEIVQWSVSRPMWQRDALQRLVTAETLTDADVDELTAICMGEAPARKALQASVVGEDPSSTKPISLHSIHDCVGVNALAPEQGLTFQPSGLTIIYGDNGSGKSGYVRVLKHACRTRDQKQKIIRDIADANQTPQSAKITICKAGVISDPFGWSPEGPRHPDLPSISIFDSRSANVHVEETNDVAYIPTSMHILAGLANACDKIKLRLDARLQALSNQTPIAIKKPTLKATSAAGHFLNTLSAGSNLKQLQILATLSGRELQKLRTLEVDLALDPQRAATRLNKIKSRFDDQCERLRGMIECSDELAFRNRDKLVNDLSAKNDAARLASGELFATAPLPDIAHATWLSLWEAARQYSDRCAYPAKTFPEAEAGHDVCVLCQQPLSELAVARRHAFESFVQGSTRTAALCAAKTLADFQSSVEQNRLSVRDIRSLATFIQNEMSDEALSGKLATAAITAAWRSRALLRGLAPPNRAPAMPDGISVMSSSIAQRARQLMADHGSQQYAALLAERDELGDREKLAPLIPDITAEIERLKHATAINKALKSVAKRPVTDKNKELSDRLVTDALRDRFAREIEKLKLSRMPIELRKTGDRSAISYFRVSLVANPNLPVGDILSEGEHRCVALAAFLAELVTAGRKSGIVFDDPMSSLDHIHRSAVAERLVEESSHRQVIVFTHDLAFLAELRRQSETRHYDVMYHTVRRIEHVPGFTEASLPVKARSCRQLTNGLRTTLNRERPHFNGWDDDQRTIFVKGAITGLREAWDQAVADCIFPVIGRFENKIKTSTFYKLAIINDDDVIAVMSARQRLSEDLHLAAEALNPAQASHADLLEEVKALEAWLDSIQLRQANAQRPFQ